MKNTYHYVHSSALRRRFAISLCAILLSADLAAQVASYSFGQSNGTYTPITGGTVLGTVTSDDQRFLDPAFPEGTTSVYTGPGFPIGFTFYFNGIAFDRTAINNNGWISFGQSSLTPSVDLNSTSSFAPLASVATNTPDYFRSRVSAFGRDIQAQAGAELRIETIGTSPNEALLVHSQTNDFYCCCAVTCTSSHETGHPNPVYVGSARLPGLQYQEDLESLLLSNEYHNCMNSTHRGLYTFIYTADWGSSNRYAHSGCKFACFKYGCSDYFFTPGIELAGGQTYQFSFYYITDGLAGWNQLSAQYGTSPDSLSMTNLIASIYYVSGISYQKFSGAFTPPTSDVYFIGINCVSAASANFLTIDDLSLTESDCYAPANVAVSYVSATAAQLDWDCNGCSGDFYVEYGLAPTYFGWVGNIGVNAGSSPYILSNLLPAENLTNGTHVVRIISKYGSLNSSIILSR
jgi:hypothetical protein